MTDKFIKKSSIPNKDNNKKYLITYAYDMKKHNYEDIVTEESNFYQHLLYNHDLDSIKTNDYLHIEQNNSVKRYSKSLNNMFEKLPLHLKKIKIMEIKPPENKIFKDNMVKFEVVSNFILTQYLKTFIEDSKYNDKQRKEMLSLVKSKVINHNDYAENIITFFDMQLNINKTPPSKSKMKI